MRKLLIVFIVLSIAAGCSSSSSEQDAAPSATSLEAPLVIPTEQPLAPSVTPTEQSIVPSAPL